jgi:RES domain-containing protein
MVEIKSDLPEDLVEFLRDSDLPSDWNSLADAESTKDIGTDWAKSRRTVVLSVPSVVVPQERNFLLNPRHPEFSKITFHPPKPFVFDPRLR